MRSSRGASRSCAGGPCSTITPSFHGHTVGDDLPREAHLVGDDDHRHALASKLAHHSSTSLRAPNRARSCLVEEHHVRVHRERAPRSRRAAAADRPRAGRGTRLGLSERPTRAINERARSPASAWSDRAPSTGPSSRSRSPSSAGHVELLADHPDLAADVMVARGRALAGDSIPSRDAALLGGLEQVDGAQQRAFSDPLGRSRRRPRRA